MITREEALRKIQAFIDFCPAIKTEMEETVEALSVPQWIKVEVDLPCNHSDLVLMYNGTPFSTKRVLVMTDVHTLFLCEMKRDDDRGWIWSISTKDKITHWMRIPDFIEEQMYNTNMTEDRHCSYCEHYWTNGEMMYCCKLQHRITAARKNGCRHFKTMVVKKFNTNQTDERDQNKDTAVE